MKNNYTFGDPVEILRAARTIADYAHAQGVHSVSHHTRLSCNHIGAVLADSILQAGLNYRSVVRPRIHRILLNYPQANVINNLITIVKNGETPQFLNWEHHEKIFRFDTIVQVMYESNITDTDCLRENLGNNRFCKELQNIRGVGPKTVDYMSCLVGVESVAVDRHVRSFAKRAGIIDMNYHYLKNIFCFAADLLSISRRGFDAWIWQIESQNQSEQFSLAF